MALALSRVEKYGEQRWQEPPTPFLPPPATMQVAQPDDVSKAGMAGKAAAVMGARGGQPGAAQEQAVADVIEDAAREAIVTIGAAIPMPDMGMKAQDPPKSWEAKRLNFTARVVAAADSHIRSLKLQDQWDAYRPFLAFHQEPDTDLVVDIAADLLGRFEARGADPQRDWADCEQVLPTDVAANIRLLGHKDDGGLPNARDLLCKLRPFYSVARFLGLDMKDLMRDASESLQQMNVSSSGFMLRAAFGTLATLDEVRRADNVFKAVGALFRAVLEAAQSPWLLVQALWTALLDLVNFGGNFTTARGVASNLASISGVLGTLTSPSELKALFVKLITAVTLMVILVLAIWFLPGTTLALVGGSLALNAVRALYETCGTQLNDVWNTVKGALSTLGAGASTLGRYIAKHLPQEALDTMHLLGAFGAKLSSIAGWLMKKARNVYDWVSDKLTGHDKVKSYRDAIEYAAAAMQLRAICKTDGEGTAGGAGGRRRRHFAHASAATAMTMVVYTSFAHGGGRHRQRHQRRHRRRHRRQSRTLTRVQR
jgi:hypothetical protein